MAEKRSPTPPPTGFLIMSDGSVLRGTDSSTYRESQIEEWLTKWRFMKALGCFNDNDASTSSSSLTQLTGPGANDQLPHVQQPKEEKHNDKKKQNDKKKNKKGKKGKKH